MATGSLCARETTAALSTTWPWDRGALRDKLCEAVLCIAVCGVRSVFRRFWGRQSTTALLSSSSLVSRGRFMREKTARTKLKNIWPHVRVCDRLRVWGCCFVKAGNAELSKVNHKTGTLQQNQTASTTNSKNKELSPKPYCTRYWAYSQRDVLHASRDRSFSRLDYNAIHGDFNKHKIMQSSYFVEYTSQNAHGLEFNNKSEHGDALIWSLCIHFQEFHEKMFYQPI